MPDRSDSHEDVTRWLRAWRGGDAAALEQLIPVVYGQLRRLARRELRRERADHSLQTADLVNELYMRLVEQRKAKWEDRVHFFAICSQLLRRILVDHARKRGTAKRAGEMLKVPLEAASLVADERHAELIAVDKALEEFEKLDPRKARVVELRFFGGLTIEETAAALGCSEATVEREWRAARAWLNGELRRQLAPRPAGRVAGAS